MKYITALIASALIFSPLSVSGSDIVVIESVPSAEDLQKILFPDGLSTDTESTGATRSLGGKTRTIVIREDTKPESRKTTRIAAMLINFEFGKAVILPTSQPYLDALGEMMNKPEMRESRLIVEGHTDSIGSDAYNQRLSEERALAVRRYLVSRHGIDALRLHPLGKGETELLDKRNSRAAINRRVQFKPL